MTRMRKDYRELKVSSFSGYGYKSAPMLRIQGLWLEELGFNIGDPILVKCEDGKLIITVDHAREDAETKEQAFLDEEMVFRSCCLTVLSNHMVSAWSHCI